MKIDSNEQMGWKKYAAAALTFNLFGFLLLFLLNLVQNILPLNPQHFSGISWDLAFNSAASFVTNTNWQAYSGESSMSYLTQMLGFCVQNFLSAATGIAVLFALIRGFIKVKETGIGTKAQQALKLQQEQGKLERKFRSRERREQENQLKFQLRFEKRKQKHRGH